MAQSFTIESSVAPHGVFLTGIDLWFAGKGTQDVSVEIREMVNGYPSLHPLPCISGSDKAISTMPADLVNVKSGTSLDSLPDPRDINSATTFEFAAPVYLKPQGEYCVVVRCPGEVDYFLWSSDLRGNVLGSTLAGSPTPVDVAKASTHYMGSLFLSQNAKTWEPDQYKDLMFRLRIANFTASQGEAIFRAGTERYIPVYNSDDGLLSDEQYVAPLTEDYSFDSFNSTVEARVPVGDNGKSSGTIVYAYDVPLASAGSTGYTSFTPKTNVDLAEPVKLEKDKIGDISAGAQEDQGSFAIKATITSLADNRISPVIDASTMQLITMQNYINDGRIQDKNIQHSGAVGSGFNVGDTFNVVPKNADNHTKIGGNTALIRVESNTASGGILSLNVSPSAVGAFYHETPTLSEASWTAGAALSDINSQILITGETGSGGGNAKFRYVTKPVKLKSGMEAFDLSVKMDINKPFGSRVFVYYKVMHKHDTDPLGFDNKKWVLMKQSSPADERHSINESNAWVSSDKTPMIEHTFSSPTTGDIITYEDSHGNSYDGFKYFAIKIVGFSENSAKVPVIGNLRAIAVT